MGCVGVGVGMGGTNLVWRRTVAPDSFSRPPARELGIAADHETLRAGGDVAARKGVWQGGPVLR